MAHRIGAPTPNLTDMERDGLDRPVYVLRGDGTVTVRQSLTGMMEFVATVEECYTCPDRLQLDGQGKEVYRGPKRTVGVRVTKKANGEIEYVTERYKALFTNEFVALRDSNNVDRWRHALSKTTANNNPQQAGLAQQDGPVPGNEQCNIGQIRDTPRQNHQSGAMKPAKHSYESLPND